MYIYIQQKSLIHTYVYIYVYMYVLMLFAQEKKKKMQLILNFVILAILYLSNKTIFTTSTQRNWFAHFMQLFIICYWKNRCEIY